MVTILCALLLAAPSDASPSEAETFAAAGDEHLRRAPTAERPLAEYDSAHKNFDSAYLVADDVRYLCRALAVAELTLLRAPFADEQERLSWEDLRRDDLERLGDNARERQRGNCRFDASGKLAPRVALLDLDAPVSVTADGPVAPSPASMSEGRRPMPSRAQVRRSRAHTAAGALLTTAGLGLLGGTFGVIGVELQRAAEMKSLIDTAKAERRKFTDAEDQRFGDLAGDLLRRRDAAIGVGVAGLVALGAGIAVLATRPKVTMRRYALQPYGGLQGVGAILRLKF